MRSGVGVQQSVQHGTHGAGRIQRHGVQVDPTHNAAPTGEQGYRLARGGLGEEIFAMTLNEFQKAV